MLGNMMKQGLLISQLIEHAEQSHPTQEIVSRRTEGDIHRYTYKDLSLRSKQLANALNNYGIKLGDRVATLAWNTYRHYECYFGISGIGAVIHTINPRLFPEQITYIVNHAEDRLIFVDTTFLPLLEAVKSEISCIEKIVVLCESDALPQTSLDNCISYEAFIGGESSDFLWPEFDEDTAAGLCYTSGTTGNPKGVLYSHRSTMLHAWSTTSADTLNISAKSVCLPVVPMFHVNAWGTPYAAAMTGSKMVLPGAGMDGAALTELIQNEKVTLLLGVPTVWLGLLNHLNDVGVTLDTVDSVVIGGSAAPISMIKEFDEKHDAFVIHAWGMTEMSPLGTLNSRTRQMDALPLEERYKKQLKQGKPVFGVELKITDDDDNELPHDGVAFGKLLVKGPWVTDGYFKNDDRSSFVNGWFDTGDVATIDEDNMMQIVDRSKDVIKSGGEWISSIDLENAAVGHPDLSECCVIGVRHEKWDERPLLLAIKNEGASCSEEEVLRFLEDKVAKWWLPDAVVFVNELPHTATGKLLKVPLREEYQDYLINN